MPKSNQTLSPEILSQLLGETIAPQQQNGAMVFSPGQVDRLGLLAAQQGAAPQDQTDLGELLRRIAEIRRTRGPGDQAPAPQPSVNYNPFDVLSQVLGG